MSERDLFLDVQEHDGVGQVAVGGDVTVYEAPRLRDVLRTTISRNELVLIDLSRASFLDSTALGVLVGALKVARSSDVGFELVVPDGDIRKILRITGLAKVFCLHTSVDDALDHGRADLIE